MHAPKQNKKVRMVIYCSVQERACIKMLAARRFMTMGEYLLYIANEDWNKKFKENERGNE